MKTKLDLSLEKVANDFMEVFKKPSINAAKNPAPENPLTLKSYKERKSLDQNWRETSTHRPLLKKETLLDKVKGFIR